MGSNVQNLLRAILRHKLTPVEWQIVAACLVSEGFALDYYDLLHFRAWRNEKAVHIWRYTQQGYSKAAAALEARGWVSLERRGRRDGPSKVTLLPLIVLADDPHKRPPTTPVVAGSTDNASCGRSTTTRVFIGREKGGR